jgi:hypothetical protein
MPRHNANTTTFAMSRRFTHGVMKENIERKLGARD